VMVPLTGWFELQLKKRRVAQTINQSTGGLA
jgi:hypothetical protein